MLNIIVALALLTVLGTLVMGMWNMRKPGMEARMLSNRLMRIRVLAQAVAIAVFLVIIALKHQAAG